MSLARLVVAGVRVEGRTKSEVARDYRVSRQWVHELIKRFDAEGEAGLEPRSRRPRGSPQRTPEALEDQIVELRKSLTDQGLDAGAHTIAYHLGERRQPDLEQPRPRAGPAVGAGVRAVRGDRPGERPVQHQPEQGPTVNVNVAWFVVN